MPRGQLAQLPLAEGRHAERRVVNLAASLREPGAAVADADVLDLSTDGFKAVSDLTLEVGGFAFLKLAGLAVQKAQVVWIEEGKAGFRFTSPMHPAELEQLVASERKTAPRNHFGPRGRTPR